MVAGRHSYLFLLIPITCSIIQTNERTKTPLSISLVYSYIHALAWELRENDSFLSLCSFWRNAYAFFLDLFFLRYRYFMRNHSHWHISTDKVIDNLIIFNHSEEIKTIFKFNESYLLDSMVVDVFISKQVQVMHTRGNQVKLLEA